MFKGSMVALVTPMQEDGQIDQRAVQELVEWHIQNNTQAIVAAGTTGESATLEPHEQFELTSLIVKQAAGRIPVIAGAGTNSTRTTLTLAENAKRAGADACLLVTPYYNKPTQNGLYQHYKFIAEKIAMPIILYNVPTRTSCDLLPETIAKLSKVEHIVGIKEATGKIERAKEIMQACDKHFSIISGDDATALELILAGASGVISVTANVAPKQMYNMCDALSRNDIALAKSINDTLMPLHKYLFIESNPIPTKWILHSIMGKIPSGIRLPLVTLDSQYHQKLKEVLKTAGVY